MACPEAVRAVVRPGCRRRLLGAIASALGMLLAGGAGAAGGVWSGLGPMVAQSGDRSVDVVVFSPADNRYYAGIGSGTVYGQVSTAVVATSFTGASASGSGMITAAFSGGGSACGYSFARFVAAPGAAGGPPDGIVFPHGLFDFTAGGCAPGTTLSVTITYPDALPAGTRYWKYGPTAADPAPHWYVLPATVDGNTARFSITDGGLGDDDLSANGIVRDQGGAGLAAAGGPDQVRPVPGLSAGGLLALAVLLASAARRWRKPGWTAG